MCVFTSACTARPSARSAEPALNPNHPNHKSPVPINVSGSECGGIGAWGQPRRRPMTSTTASAAIPALMCTTVPPAKSSAPRRASQPAGANTQCATGAYTSTTQSPTNQAHAPNRTRSAIAPVISAGVITANIIWYAMYNDGGIVSASPCGAVLKCASHAKSKFPIHLFVPPKAIEYTTTAQSTLTRPRQKKFCISIVSTFRARTIPA